MKNHKTSAGSEKTDRQIARIVSNGPLAEAIYRSVDAGLRSNSAHIANEGTVWDVFQHSLNAAIRDIKEHKRGKLFQRLLEYGVSRSEDSEVLISDGKTSLSDPECGSCVDFIYSHMITRFKGELAELLAIEPCLRLIQELKRKKRISSRTQLYWGDSIQEPCQIPGTALTPEWAGFRKGADGLLVEELDNILKVHGVIEVKSMVRARKRVLGQIDNHIARLRGGVELVGRRFPPNKIQFSGGLRIIVLPSNWKVSREKRKVKTKRGWNLVFPKNVHPSTKTLIQELEPNVWKITLAWSQEALNQAAFQMTFWFMAKVGESIYRKKNLPSSLGYMRPAEAGQNNMKQELYYIPLRPISQRQKRLAVKLFNVYGYGYPLGVDAPKILTNMRGSDWRYEILWPEDIFGEDVPAVAKKHPEPKDERSASCTNES
jgi:hypothetical protein